MSKSIKVDEQVYQELLKLQRPRETFSQLVLRLLLIEALMQKVQPYIASERQRFEKQAELLHKSPHLAELVKEVLGTGEEVEDAGPEISH